MRNPLRFVRARKENYLGNEQSDDCGKTISAQQCFDGPRVWDKPRLSGYLVCLVCLVEQDRLDELNKPDEPDRPHEQNRLANRFSILLERPFSLKIPAKAAHQFGTECPTFRFLHVRIGKMPTNFPKTFLRLLIPLQPLGLL